MKKGKYEFKFHDGNIDLAPQILATNCFTGLKRPRVTLATQLAKALDGMLSLSFSGCPDKACLVCRRNKKVKDAAEKALRRYDRDKSLQ